jgi:hypothetical protein
MLYTKETGEFIQMRKSLRLLLLVVLQDLEVSEDSQYISLWNSYVIKFIPIRGTL